jgi:hypothetical protein
MDDGESWLWDTCLPAATEARVDTDLNVWLGHRNALTWNASARRWILLDDAADAARTVKEAGPRTQTRRRMAKTLRAARL